MVFHGRRRNKSASQAGAQGVSVARIFWSRRFLVRRARHYPITARHWRTGEPVKVCDPTSIPREVKLLYCAGRLFWLGWRLVLAQHDLHSPSSPVGRQRSEWHKCWYLGTSSHREGFGFHSGCVLHAAMLARLDARRYLWHYPTPNQEDSSCTSFTRFAPCSRALKAASLMPCAPSPAHDARSQ